MNEKSFKEYLASGETNATDASLDLTSAAIRGWRSPLKAQPKPQMPPHKDAAAGGGNPPGGLDAHDKKYHPNWYKDGDSCNYRASLEKNDKADDLHNLRGVKLSDVKGVTINANKDDKVNSYLKMGSGGFGVRSRLDDGTLDAPVPELDDFRNWLGNP